MSTPAQTNPASVTLLTVQASSIGGIVLSFAIILLLAQSKGTKESNINVSYQLITPTSALLLHLALKLARTRRIKFSGREIFHTCLGFLTAIHSALSICNLDSFAQFFSCRIVPLLILCLQIIISYNSNKLPASGLPISRDTTDSTLLLASRPAPRNIIGQYAHAGFIASFITTALAAGVEESLRATGFHLLSRIAITTIIVLCLGAVSAKCISGKLASARAKYSNHPKEIYFTAPVLAGIFSAAGLLTTTIGDLVNNKMLQFFGVYVAATATTLISIQNPRDTNLQELKIPTCGHSSSL